MESNGTNHLRKLREKAELSQDRLARRAALSVGSIVRLETQNRPPSLATARKVASALGVTVDEIWPQDGPQGPETASEGEKAS